ncbi:MAG: DUF4367 domain-containing protein [Chloroflexi bacterium]|nr:DUF4367 domain-containing protein [Chloroflexota bacterium]
MRRRTVFLIVILALASVGLAAFALQPSAADLLIQSIETLQTVSDGHAVIEFEADTPEQSGSGAVEVWGMLDAGPNGEPAFRVEVLETSLEMGAGVTAVGDGVNFWLYNPDENIVLTGTYEETATMLMERYANADFEGKMPHGFEGEFDPEEMAHPETPEEAVAKLLEYFDAERVGLTSGDVAGVGAYQVRLIPIPEQMPEEVRAAGGLINVWIAAESKAPLAAEYTGGNFGSGRVEATFLEFNQGVDESVFTFDIPDGAEVMTLADLEAIIEEHMAEAQTDPDFDALVPQELPADARLVDIKEMRGVMVQEYARPDGRSFTVAQGRPGFDYAPEGQAETVAVRGVDGQLYNEDGVRTLLIWTEGDFQFWIGGDLTADEALAIAESLR